jgi:hypothetical protein
MNDTVKLSKEKGNLILTASGDARLEVCLLAVSGASDVAAWFELLEYHLCNGWDSLRPEEIGALTACPFIVSDDVQRDDQGRVTRVGKVYWYEQYAIDSPVEELARNGSVTLRGVPNEDD